MKPKPKREGQVMHGGASDKFKARGQSKTPPLIDCGPDPADYCPCYQSPMCSTEHARKGTISKGADDDWALIAETAKWKARAETLLALLREWIAPPHFPTFGDVYGWIRSFRPKVESVMAEVEADLAKSDEVLVGSEKAGSDLALKSTRPAYIGDRCDCRGSGDHYRCRRRLTHFDCARKVAPNEAPTHLCRQCAVLKCDHHKRRKSCG